MSSRGIQGSSGVPKLHLGTARRDERPPEGEVVGLPGTHDVEPLAEGVEEPGTARSEPLEVWDEERPLDPLEDSAPVLEHVAVDLLHDGRTLEPERMEALGVDVDRLDGRDAAEATERLLPGRGRGKLPHGLVRDVPMVRGHLDEELPSRRERASELREESVVAVDPLERRVR